MEPRLEALLGLSEAPTGDRAELFAAWRMSFTRIAEIDTVVMVFEDLHWADDGLLDFIDELTSAAIDYPILVVTLGRRVGLGEVEHGQHASGPASPVDHGRAGDQCRLRCAIGPR